MGGIEAPSFGLLTNEKNAPTHGFWGREVSRGGMVVAIVLGEGLVSVTLDEVLECPAVLGPTACGSWNFPRFLLSEGSLTLMYMASLMFLTMP